MWQCACTFVHLNVRQCVKSAHHELHISCITFVPCKVGFVLCVVVIYVCYHILSSPLLSSLLFSSPLTSSLLYFSSSYCLLETDDSDIKIADFGFAKKACSLLPNESACGTPG